MADNTRFVAAKDLRSGDVIVERDHYGKKMNIYHVVQVERVGRYGNGHVVASVGKEKWLKGLKATRILFRYEPLSIVEVA